MAFYCGFFLVSVKSFQYYRNTNVAPIYQSTLKFFAIVFGFFGVKISRFCHISETCHHYIILLTHISLVSFLWDICKQCRPRSDAPECGKYANSEDPDQTRQSTLSKQGLHCLHIIMFSRLFH